MIDSWYMNNEIDAVSSATYSKENFAYYWTNSPFNGKFYYRTFSQEIDIIIIPCGKLRNLSMAFLSVAFKD